jgi:hypothetical protein
MEKACVIEDAVFGLLQVANVGIVEYYNLTIPG